MTQSTSRSSRKASRFGKRMMAEMIATYSGPPSTGEARRLGISACVDTVRGGYLNEVSLLTARIRGVSAYRFCRTDDIGLLVDALNRCWAPYFGEPPMTAAAFKRSIRDLSGLVQQHMVAFSRLDPIGVLIGAKRASGTLIHEIAVHPDHRRQGHGRHLLTSLGSKLSILGPPRIVAEIPEALAPACELFSACGYVEEARLTDYVLTVKRQRRRRGAAP